MMELDHKTTFREFSSTVRIVGGLPYNAEIGIPAAVWAQMGPKAQEAVNHAWASRERLRGVEALSALCDHAIAMDLSVPLRPLSALPADKASAAGITVLHSGADGCVDVGYFDVPSLDDYVAKSPKSFSFASPLRVLLLRQRIEYAFEFVRAVMGQMSDSGVLLAGADGIGKSGVGLLTYLLCVRLGLMVAYIPRAQDWVADAEIGNGVEHLLETTWRLNADIIAASEPLRAIFQAAMEDHEQPFDHFVYYAFHDAVNRREVPGVGIIVDDMDPIIRAVNGRAQAVTAPAKLAADYFVIRWYKWSNGTGVFARMYIASLQGCREFAFSDGEQHRRRHMQPMPAEVTAVLQSTKDSPAYVEDLRLREYVAFLAGGVLRRLVKGAGLAHGQRNSDRLRKHMWHELTYRWDDSCERWLASIPESNSPYRRDHALAVAQGRMIAVEAEPLYEDGLAAGWSVTDRSFVQPVAPVAAASSYKMRPATCVRGAST